MGNENHGPLQETVPYEPLLQALLVHITNLFKFYFCLKPLKSMSFEGASEIFLYGADQHALLIILNSLRIHQPTEERGVLLADV